ncbi:MAG: hypothetical protein M0C28_44365 [Candidatus Moduliflexus flocculans]|nr:hypothetical protein [Candidatus Moduliflexus flocculans]
MNLADPTARLLRRLILVQCLSRRSGQGRAHPRAAEPARFPRRRKRRADRGGAGRILRSVDACRYGRNRWLNCRMPKPTTSASRRLDLSKNNSYERGLKLDPTR